jgi:hypothetical protein
LKQQEEPIMAAKKKARKPAGKVTAVVFSAIEETRARAGQLKKIIKAAKKELKEVRRELKAAKKDARKRLKAVRAEAEKRVGRVRAAAGLRRPVSTTKAAPAAVAKPRPAKVVARKVVAKKVVAKTVVAKKQPAPKPVAVRVVRAAVPAKPPAPATLIPAAPATGTVASSGGSLATRTGREPQ